MLRKVKALAAKLDGLSLIPGTQAVEGENPLPQVLTSTDV